MCQKSRSRRFSQKSTHSSGQESPAKVEPKSKLSKTCQRVLANLFVDKIPLDTTKAELMDLFAKYYSLKSLLFLSKVVLDHHCRVLSFDMDMTCLSLYFQIWHYLEHVHLQAQPLQCRRKVL